MIEYYDLGKNKQLNEIVMAGSHDAGINQGAANVKTHDLQIGAQAYEGVRVFDLRVTAAGMPDQGDGRGKQAELRAFHADPKLMKNEVKTRIVREYNTAAPITRTKLSGGGFGMSLTDMLRQARSFVRNYVSEFLILKFDKCENWKLIAQVCVDALDDEWGTLYKGTGNLNTTTLEELKGKVIVLFTPSGLAEVAHDFPLGSGILGVTNLARSGAGYNPFYHGMQYFGKGGTKVSNIAGDKITENEVKQARLMSRGAGGHPDVMGMMYWTTTGINESILSRNQTMWNPPNVRRLENLWRAGLKEAIESRLASNVNPTSSAATPILKAFMPNIVMIDFADEFKCKQIYSLNHLAANDLTTAAQNANV
jgi:hypothetical protein